MAIKDYQLCSFDSIIVTAGAPFIPQPYGTIKIGGRLVIL
jgi:protein-L-isoaspartate O-methyltransferase